MNLISSGTLYVKIVPKPLSLNQLILILSLAHVRKIVLICLLNSSRLYTPPTCPKILQFLKIPFFDLPNNCGSDGLPGDFLYKIRQAGRPSQVTNYRRVSVLANEQYGFRPGGSTSTYFVKAFDSVNHELLIAVLKAYGFGDPLLSQFNSFLINRAQWVKLFNTKSEVIHPSSGVPLGEHLSSLLFSLFVNSAFSSLKHCQLLCFADDMKLFMKISSITDCLNLQNGLNNFVAWSESLGLSLNISKCRYYMTFFRRRIPISFSYSINGTNLSPIVTRPIAEYGSIVFDSQTPEACKQLERVQRKFLSFVKFNFKTTIANLMITLPSSVFYISPPLSDRRYQ
ncbi:putative RNA-directed DNA polymerase [Aphis craccivora]|uniref:Putative RNA-directed DNA polymerase n=1 Tax=Aphis craccivora TaxID=307492 RepID=A0A6G0Z0C8_APHCR|nr:putative RNA-directed DNA polymerase [Aphis craccivora]